MASRWYYQMLMEEFGPVTVEQLRELFIDGTLGERDLVRSEADDAWISLASVMHSLPAGSGDAPEPAMEQIGDLSELAFEFEDSGPTSRRNVYTQESTQDSPPVSQGPVSRISAQDPGPVVESPVPAVASQRLQASQPTASDQPAEEWFCESLGQVMGPMSFDEIIHLGESGALDANDRVRCGERGIWKTVDCLPRVMRAVAVGSAIHVDPAVVSATTQKGPDNPAVAAMDDLSDPPAGPMAREPQLPQQESQTPQDTVAGKPRAAKLRPKRRKNAKGEEALLDEIFDDVFNDDSPPAKTTTATQATAATAGTAPFMNTPPLTPAMSPPIPAGPALSSPASQASLRDASGRLAAAAKASRPSKRSSASSFKADPKMIGILVAVMLVAAGGWYVWQYGLSGSTGNGNGTFDTAGSVKVLKAAVDRYRAMGASPSEAEWRVFSEKTEMEMNALFKTVYAQAGATPNGEACLAATLCIRRIAHAQPDNKEFIDKNLVEFERQIVLVTK